MDRALIFSADSGFDSALGAFKRVMPRAVVAISVAGDGDEAICKLQERLRGIVEVERVDVDRDFHALLDAVGSLVERLKSIELEPFVSISSSHPEVSAALYVATMFRGGRPISLSGELPPLRIFSLSDSDIEVLRALRELGALQGSGRRASLDDLAKRVYESHERSKKALVDYFVKKHLEDKGLVERTFESRSVVLQLTKLGEAIARRHEDYLEVFKKKEEDEDKSPRAVVEAASLRRG